MSAPARPFLHFLHLLILAATVSFEKMSNSTSAVPSTAVITLPTGYTLEQYMVLQGQLGMSKLMSLNLNIA